jgi:hypothetical protein
MSDAVAGLPDRYLPSGIWVEFKSLYRVRGGFTFGEGLSAEQWIQCEALALNGDKVFYCAQLDGWEHGKRYIFTPFTRVAARRDQRLLVENTVPATSGMRDHLTREYLLP